jgi:outer membrane protein TolC
MLGSALMTLGTLVAAAPQDRPENGTAVTRRIQLHEAVRLALQQNFGILSAADATQAAKFRESATRADFYPKLTPTYATSHDEKAFSLQASQKLPWSGGSLTATGVVRSTSNAVEPARTSDVRVLLSQPLLRGFGPTVTNYDLVNSRRAREAQERSFDLARQQLAIAVTTAYYQVIRQRQLLEVSRQSLKRSENLRDASMARMQVGLASRLDVLRAELQASQASDGMVSAQASLDTATEIFRVQLGLSPGEAVEPEETALPETDAQAEEPLEILIARALENRLELHETRDEIKDAERTLVLTRQNLLPQLNVNFAFSQIGYGSSLEPRRNSFVPLSSSRPSPEPPTYAPALCSARRGSGRLTICPSVSGCCRRSSNRRAATREGLLRPCSHPSSVRTLSPSSRAKSGRERWKRSRTSRMVCGSTTGGAGTSTL